MRQRATGIWVAWQRAGAGRIPGKARRRHGGREVTLNQRQQGKVMLMDGQTNFRRKRDGLLGEGHFVLVALISRAKCGKVPRRQSEARNGMRKPGKGWRGDTRL
jgi:hypothetical protein